MRLRLSKRFYAALMAAIASVTFTFSVQQAAAAEQMDASASSETETAMAVEASEAEESEEIEEEEENREPDSAPEVSVGFNGIIGCSDAFDFLGDIENVGNLDSASQQQAGAQSVSSSASLPSNDLGFTTNAYAGSIAEALVDVAAPSVPAAIASELKLTTPAKSTSSGSSSSSSDDYSSVADASTVSGSAWNASYGSHISAPAFRSLSSKAPSNFAAANGTGSSLVIDTPAGDSVPLLGADEPTWIFSFDNGVETKYFYTEQDAYEFKVDAGKTGVIKFNNLMSELEVKGDFKMIGEKFTIDTNGVVITFDEPMSNYGTEFTVQDSSAGKSGKIIANGPAAFKSLHVESGEMVIASQIGVVDQLSVGAAGATLTVTEEAKVILTQQVECQGGTIKLYGTVDASNLPNSVARAIGVKFVDQAGHEFDKDGNPYTSGFLAAGKWSLGKKGSDPNSEVIIGDNAKVVVAFNEYDIKADPITGLPVVILEAPDMRLWFQNGGLLESAGDVFQGEGGNAQVLLARTEDDPTSSVNVDLQVRDDCVMYVSQGTNANIHLSYDEDFFPNGALGQLYLMNGSTTMLTSVTGYNSQINTVTFVGQNVVLTCNDDPAWTVGEITPNGLTVESATTAHLAADIKPYFGYYQGEGDIAYRAGSYTLRGQLTIEDGYTFDFRHPNHLPTWAPVARYDGGETTLIFEETLTRLTMGDEGVLVLSDEATFKASTVTDGSTLTADKRNLDTTRIAVVEGSVDPAQYEYYWTEEMDNAKFQLNGTMEITDGARMVALNENVADGVVNNYTTRNQDFMIIGGTVTANDEIGVDDWGDPIENPNLSATTVSNQLNQSNVINAKESGFALTLDNANENTVELGHVYAKNGDIYITKKEEVTAFKVQIAENLTVAAENATLTVENMLLAEGGPTEDSVGTASKVKADVVLLEGATLDVSNALGKGGLDLAGSFTIQSGAMLSEKDMLAVGAMEIGDKYDLAFNVTSFNERMNELSMDLQNAIDASDLFGDQFWKGEYYVCYTGSGSQGQSTGNGSNVGTVYLYKATPEPTTGTLSLLALAALAARRRRKG